MGKGASYSQGEDWPAGPQERLEGRSEILGGEWGVWRQQGVLGEGAGLGRVEVETLSWTAINIMEPLSGRGDAGGWGGGLPRLPGSGCEPSLVTLWGAGQCGSDVGSWSTSGR